LSAFGYEAGGKVMPTFGLDGTGNRTNHMLQRTDENLELLAGAGEYLESAGGRAPSTLTIGADLVWMPKF
jgi:hypothetical protein